MRVRALDSTGDWTYGQGQNNYLVDLPAVSQNIQTRVLSFLGDCFFDLSAGIDWFTFLGSKNEIALNLAIAAVILNTTYVTGLAQLSIDLDHDTRVFSVTYRVQTGYSTLNGAFQYSLNGFISNG